MLFCWEKRQHLTIIVYVSYFLCVYCAQCDVLCDFCMKWFCCCMKTKTIVPNVFGVCVNFKIRKLFSGLLYNSVVRWRWEREGVKDGCYNLLLAAAACPWPDRSAIGYLKWATCVADLDSRALALTKEASGNSRAWHHHKLTFFSSVGKPPDPTRVR